MIHGMASIVMRPMLATPPAACTASPRWPDVPLLPSFIAPAHFADAEAALAHVRAIYDNSVDHLRNALQSLRRRRALSGRVRAFYPFVRVHTDTVARADSRLSYGFVAGPGTFETTLTRPDLFAGYYLEQFRLLLRTTASSSRSAPACSRSRCTSRSPSTTTSRAP